MLSLARNVTRPALKLQNGFPAPIFLRYERVISSSENLKSNEDFIDRNTRLQRPLSPHLTIYKFQITTVMSITHRATGLALAGGLYGLAATSLLIPSTFPQFVSTLQDLHLSPSLIFATKLALSWSFFYHFFNGIRHLAWDAGYGFELKNLYQSGYIVLGVSAITTLAVMAI